MCCILLFFPVLTEGFRRIQWQFSLIPGRDDMRFASRFGIGYSLLQFIEMLQIIGLPAIQCFYRKFGEVDANREPVFTLRLGQPGRGYFFELTDADDAIAIFAQIQDIAKFFTFDFLLPARQQ